jgi:hypothetical protein
MKQKALFVFAHTTPRPKAGIPRKAQGLIGMSQKNFPEAKEILPPP